MATHGDTLWTIGHSTRPWEAFVAMLAEAGFRPEFLHSEEACHTGRFTK